MQVGDAAGHGAPGECVHGPQHPGAVRAVLEEEPARRLAEGNLVSATGGKLMETFRIFFITFIPRFLLI